MYTKVAVAVLFAVLFVAPAVSFEAFKFRTDIFSTNNSAARIEANFMDNGDQCGRGVSIHESNFAFGCPGKDGSVNNGGAIYIFSSGGDSFVQQFRYFLQNDSYGTNLGRDVAVGNSYAAANTPGGGGAGSLLIFRRTDEWRLELWLTAPDDETDFGDAFDLDDSASGGPLIAVGTNQQIYVYRRNSVGWAQEQELTSATIALGDSVAVENDIIVAGDPLHDQNGVSNTGALVTFRFSGGNWIEGNIIVAQERAEEDRLGTVVRIHNTRIAATAPNGGDMDNGAVHVFDVIDTVYQESAVVLPRNATTPDFAFSLGFSQNLLVCGRGYLHRFAASGTNWNPIGEVTTLTDAGVSNPPAQIGSSIDISGNRVAAGAPDADTTANQGGVAYVFDPNPASALESVFNAIF